MINKVGMYIKQGFLLGLLCSFVWTCLPGKAEAKKQAISQKELRIKIKAIDLSCVQSKQEIERRIKLARTKQDFLVYEVLKEYLISLKALLHVLKTKKRLILQNITSSDKKKLSIAFLGYTTGAEQCGKLERLSKVISKHLNDPTKKKSAGRKSNTPSFFYPPKHVDSLP